jgi:NADPH2:quinone reductase
MKAIRCHQWGEPDVLAVEEVETRQPGPGEVRIRVEASAVNFTDTLIVAGKYQFKPKLPHIPGHELAGIVLDVGKGVTGLASGDRVMASARQGGGFAEEYVGPADKVYPIPDNMSFEAAAGFIIGYGTAYFALKHRGSLLPGETLLVNGAAGGAGAAAIQVAKALGARG